MPRNRAPSAQTVTVLRALAADPLAVALRLRARSRGGPEVRLAVPDPDAAVRPRPARVGLAGDRARSAAAPRLPADGSRRRRGGPARARTCRTTSIAGAASPARRRPVTADLSSRVLAAAVRLLPAHQAQWGRAMVAELSHLHGGSSRRRFVAGCLRAILLAPRAQDAPGRSLVGVVAAAAVGCVGLVAYGLVHYPGLRTGAGVWVATAACLAVLAAYLLTAVVVVGRLTESRRALVPLVLLGGRRGRCALVARGRGGHVVAGLRRAARRAHPARLAGAGWRGGVARPECRRGPPGRAARSPAGRTAAVPRLGRGGRADRGTALRPRPGARLPRERSPGPRDLRGRRRPGHGDDAPAAGAAADLDPRQRRGGRHRQAAAASAGRRTARAGSAAR